MLPSKRPVVAVCAVRTGCGKSQTSRYVLRVLREMGKRVVAIRHPMPYGDLRRQRSQRFATIDDLKRHECTIEEMEEYEPHIQAGAVVYAGVDYQAILAEAEKEADIIIWDGGNNDTPFLKPDLLITLVDPHRPGHELSHYPGRENLEMADIVLFSKMDSADRSNVEAIEKNVRAHNAGATLVYANSPIHADHPESITGKRVVVVEDGPTLTHGGMKFGAGILAARKHDAAEIVDPRPYLVGSIADTFEKYPDIGTLIPAMGYGDQQVHDLQETLHRVDCDSVIIGTPIDLGRVLKLDKPSVRVTYELDDSLSTPSLADLVRQRMA
jgi:predicted GTPase